MSSTGQLHEGGLTESGTSVIACEVSKSAVRRKPLHAKRLQERNPQRTL